MPAALCLKSTQMRKRGIKDILSDRGVHLVEPQTIEIAADIDPEKIGEGVVVHPGCRIRGSATVLGPGTKVGEEGPATVENCQTGRHVRLKGGFFSGAVFWDRVSVGNEAHVRPGTIMEEEAVAAHAVGLKQTIMFPFVTAGSLINFCDCLMAGGTSRRNHSEIGSAFIHFNFTPQGDKATASLIGDVPRGVMLDQDPIFLGGSAGVIGPARISYGCVLPAGTVFRGDALEEGMLLGARQLREQPRRFFRSAYRGIRRLVRNNVEYIGNILALREWYREVRRVLTADDAFAEACRRGGIACLDIVWEERLKRLGQVAGKMGESARIVEEQWGMQDEAADQRAFGARWQELEEKLRGLDPAAYGTLERDQFLQEWERAGGNDYVERIQSLAPDVRSRGTAWLQQVVSAVVNCAGQVLGWW